MAQSATVHSSHSFGVRYTFLVDVIKTRYLADGTGKYRSIPDCVLQLYRAEGARGFFKVSALPAVVGS